MRQVIPGSLRFSSTCFSTKKISTNIAALLIVARMRKALVRLITPVIEREIYCASHFQNGLPLPELLVENNNSVLCIIA